MLRTLLLATALASTAPTLAQTAAAPRPAAALPAPAPLSDLVRRVDIPFSTFTLPNGLRVVVHTDRKAPVVSLHTWYDVGSADEPKGKTGFAHLFEHLMFAGSGNAPSYDLPLENAGATNNGSTTEDRTNYYVDMPRGTLDLALFLEADRMGNLLPAISQAKLDNQRGVVQNEKRQGDNQPYGLAFYAIQQNLFPPGHPYHHPVIGSMADLDRASLDDVRQWFRTSYAPNTAVLAIAGDIDAETARAKVERYFGSIPRGQATPARKPDVPRFSETRRQTMRDRVPNARVYLTWTLPPETDPENPLVNVALTVLADGGASRLYNALVREEQVALSVGSGVDDGRLASAGLIVIDVKPGVDPAKVEARADALIRDFLANGPTAEETARVATRVVSGTIRGLERVGGYSGKAAILADSWLLRGDPGAFKEDLRRYAEATPQAVRAAAAKWMSGGSFRLTVLPGERGPAELALVGQSGVATPPREDRPATFDAAKLPVVEKVETVTFPALERATLRNGVRVTFARRSAIPTVNVLASFDAGAAADPADARGLQGFMASLMEEGTLTRSGPEIVIEQERLGAGIGVGAGGDTTRATLSALKPNLAASLSLFADVVRNPAFAPAEVERVRAIQLAAIDQELAQPGGLAGRALAPAIYGASHPYGAPPSGLGDPAVVKRLTRDDLIAFHRRWLRPDKMQLFVTGDTTMAELMPLLEASFGDWRPDPAVAAGVKAFPPAVARQPTKLILIDRPGPQSYITAGQPLALTGRDDRIALQAANALIGGTFTSRLNADLRETKGWAYGVGSSASPVRQQMAFTVRAPVQADKTGPSVDAILGHLRGVTGANPPSQAELDRAVNLTVLSLPGAFETSGALVGALETMASLGRPDDYYVTLPRRYRALTAAEVAEAAKVVDPAQLQWVVVGDAAQVAPQLKPLGLPVEVRKPGS